MRLQTNFERIDLALEDPFSIARGTRETAANVIVRIADGPRTGLGGAAPSSRYDETVDSVEAVLPELLSIVQEMDDPSRHQQIARHMAEAAPDQAAARSAVSIALHDLVTKQLDVPLYRFWGLDPDLAPPSSYTISIDDPERMAEKARAAVDAGFQLLKVKVGAHQPRRSVRAVRAAVPEATIRIDANEAWEPAEAIEITQDIATEGIELVEQPIPAGDPAALGEVCDNSALPIAVDESCRDASDVPRIAESADIVVVKLSKAGGLRAAIRTIHAAQAHGLSVMLGCMVESNASLAAAMHLSPMVAYADLDGSLLLADDPFTGVPMSGGQIDLEAADRAGTGARRKA